MTIWEKAKEIEKWPQKIRIATFLRVEAELTEILARLHLHKDEEEWTEEEKKEWSDKLDELDPLWYSLSEKEQNFVRHIQRETFILTSNGNIDEEIEKYNEENE